MVVLCGMKHEFLGFENISWEKPSCVEHQNIAFCCNRVCELAAQETFDMGIVMFFRPLLSSCFEYSCVFGDDIMFDE